MSDLALAADPVENARVNVTQMLLFISAWSEFHDVGILLDGAFSSEDIYTSVNARHADVVCECVILQVVLESSPVYIYLARCCTR